VASTLIRSTYTLDVETVEMLERLARQWAVSKSEALRRAIRAAAEQGMSGEREARLSAWRQLQTGVGLTRGRAKVWERQMREERRAWRDPRS
jgi:Ribbon-helix-helix protein, copG family